MASLLLRVQLYELNAISNPELRVPDLKRQADEAPASLHRLAGPDSLGDRWGGVEGILVE